MATVSSKVFRHHKKADGTYNVKICLYHKMKGFTWIQLTMLPKRN